MSIKKYIHNPLLLADIATKIGMLDWLDDVSYCKLMFRIHIGKKLNINNPQTFNEKLQWLKLYDKNPEYTQMVDKCDAKLFIADRIGMRYVIPTIGVWDNFNDIDFESLPNQFVLKCTHDSGGVCICTDKSKFDFLKAKKLIEYRKKRNYFMQGREWPYKNVKARIIAEKFIGSDLQDYRVYCFNGEPKIIYSYTNITYVEGCKPEPCYCEYMDVNWKPYPFHQISLPRGGVPTPKNLDIMLSLSTTISKNVPFLRVDFYDIAGDLYVGELTFYPGGGFSRFYPDEWDEKLGEWLEIPSHEY